MVVVVSSRWPRPLKRGRNLLLALVEREVYPTVAELEREVYARRRPKSSRTRRNP